MSVEFLKDIKYIECLYKIKHKTSGEQLLVYLIASDDKLQICNDVDGEEIVDCENYDLDEELGQDITEPTCEMCEKAVATIIKESCVVCSNCVKAFDVEMISPGIYKFKSNEELKTVLKSKQIEWEYIQDFHSFSKGLLVLDYDYDYDYTHHKIIPSELIGDFND